MSSKNCNTQSGEFKRFKKLWIRLFIFSSTKIRILFSATLGISIFF